MLHIFINTARLTADAVNFKSAVVVECQALRAAPAQRHGEHGKDEDQRYLNYLYFAKICLVISFANF